MTTYHLQINGSSGTSQASRLESNLRRLVGVTDATADRTGNVVVRAERASCHSSGARSPKRATRSPPTAPPTGARPSSAGTSRAG